jgi:hypothetical protein
VSLSSSTSEFDASLQNPPKAPNYGRRYRCPIPIRNNVSVRGEGKDINALSRESAASRDFTIEPLRHARRCCSRDFVKLIVARNSEEILTIMKKTVSITNKVMILDSLDNPILTVFESRSFLVGLSGVLKQPCNVSRIA